MAFNSALAKAKGANQYKPIVFEESLATNCSTSDLDSSENTTRTDLLNKIFKLKQETDLLRVNIEREKLKQDWENILASEDSLMSVQSFEIRLESVIDAKEACLSILRNSVTNSLVVENSLSLRRERQAELVQVYETLVSLFLRNFATFCQIFVKSTRSFSCESI